MMTVVVNFPVVDLIYMGVFILLTAYIVFLCVTAFSLSLTTIVVECFRLKDKVLIVVVYLFVSIGVMISSMFLLSVRLNHSSQTALHEISRCAILTTLIGG